MNNRESSPEGGLRKRPGSSEESPTAVEGGSIAALKAQLKNARKNTTLLRAPITTLSIFLQLLFGWIWQGLRFLLTHRVISYALAATALTTIATVIIAGPNSNYILSAKDIAYFIIWWVTLGVLSSVGLGTGLHTFVLYLGPYIARGTLALTECGTMNVPFEGPDAFTCPPAGTPKEAVTFLRIVLKVLPACFLWGAGTAIGELPPYFVSRQARLSGQKLEELDELEEEDRGERVPTRMDRIKLVLFHALQRWGFWAIVIAASVPNPLFDLAGITCGHFLIPFWTFFGATFIGKAIVKVQIQACFVVLAFDKDRLSWLILQVEKLIPAIAGILDPLFEKQRAQFHHSSTPTAAAAAAGNGSYLSISFLWNSLLIVMLLFFVKSIIESSVQEKLVERDAEIIAKAEASGSHSSGMLTRAQEKKMLEKQKQ